MAEDGVSVILPVFNDRFALERAILNLSLHSQLTF